MSVLNPALGKTVSALSLTVQNVATDGTLTNAVNGTDAFGTSGIVAPAAINVATLVVSSNALHTSSYTVTLGILDEFELTASKVTENIRGLDRPHAHNVPIALAYGFTISEILRPGDEACQLAGIWFGGNTKIVKCVFAARRRRWTLYGVMTDYVENYAQGKNIGRLTCRPCNVGASSVAIATGVDR
jgi:hypothetical protein